MDIQIKPMYNFLDIKKFKLNETNIIQKILLNNIKLLDIYEQIFYGHCTFATPKHNIWKVNLLDEYSTKTNLIVIKLKKDKILNPKNYLYLVIFQNSTNIIDSYGYLWVTGDEQKEAITHICLEHRHDDLLQSIIRDINSWPTVKFYNAINHIPKEFNYKEIQEIYKEYIETYRDPSYQHWESLLRQYNCLYKL